MTWTFDCPGWEFVAAAAVVVVDDYYSSLIVNQWKYHLEIDHHCHCPPPFLLMQYYQYYSPY